MTHSCSLRKGLRFGHYLSTTWPKWGFTITDCMFSTFLVTFLLLSNTALYFAEKSNITKLRTSSSFTNNNFKKRCDSNHFELDKKTEYNLSVFVISQLTTYHNNYVQFRAKYSLYFYYMSLLNLSWLLVIYLNLKCHPNILKPK